MGFDAANGKAFIGGAGNAPMSFTARPDIARYVAYVLTTLPESKLEWKSFHIEGDRLVSQIYTVPISIADFRVDFQ